MPTFIDWHPASELASDLKENIQRRMREGTPDAFGVIERGVILDRDGHRLYCILEAPSEDAVRKHHAAEGVPIEAVHRADALL